MSDAGIPGALSLGRQPGEIDDWVQRLHVLARKQIVYPLRSQRGTANIYELRCALRRRRKTFHVVAADARGPDGAVRKDIHTKDGSEIGFIRINGLLERVRRKRGIDRNGRLNEQIAISRMTPDRHSKRLVCPERHGVNHDLQSVDQNPDRIP